MGKEQEVGARVGVLEQLKGPRVAAHKVEEDGLEAYQCQLAVFACIRKKILEVRQGAPGR